MLLNQNFTNYEVKIRNLNDTALKLLKCLPVDREKWTDGFSDVFALCVSRPVSHAPDLYNSTVVLIKNRISEILETLEKLDDADLLRTYVDEWKSFYEGINRLNNLYSYVNNQYVKNLKPSEPDIFYGPTLIMAERHILEIIEVGLSHWKLCLVDKLRIRLSSCLIKQIENDRNHFEDQQEYIEPTLSSFLQLSELKNIDKFGTDVYEENFQTALESSTVQFYCNWVKDRLVTCNPPSFSHACLSLKKEEIERSTKYFPSSLKCIQSIFQKIIVEENLDYINKSTRDLIENNSIDELHSIYNLLSDYNYFTNLLEEFHAYAKSKIIKTIVNLEDDQNIVESFVLNLLNLRMQFTDFISKVFEKRSIFQTNLDKAFLEAISTCSSEKTLNFRPCELLTRYIDKILKNSAKVRTELLTREALQGAIKIFTYIEDKDIFLKYYQHYLSRRLLLVNSKYSLSHEQSVVYQLSVVCGHEFTANLSLMLEDVSATADLNAEYYKSIYPEYSSESLAESSYPVYFNILRKNAWPISLGEQQSPTKYSNFFHASADTFEFEFMLPVSLEKYLADFESYYLKTHRNCKVEWAHSYSTIEMNVNFATSKSSKKNAVTIVLLTNLAAFLTRFDEIDRDEIILKELIDFYQEKAKSHGINTKDRSSTNDHPPIKSSRLNNDQRAPIVPETSIPNISQSESNKECKSLQTLLDPIIESGIITAENLSVNNEFTLKTILKINRNFTTTAHRLKFIVNNSVKETMKETVQEKQITDDRRFFIQAIIVRIMKKDKTLTITELIQKVIETAKDRFDPPKSLVKTCIQGLIDREFLERNPLDHEKLNYLV